MSQLIKSIANELAKHHSWEYTDYDNDQIRCVCGWTSNGFSPRTKEMAYKTQAAHQAEVLMKNS
jgi:hypothetical protein